MSDFLTITQDNAPTPEQPQGGSKDPNFWKPSIKNKNKEYQAQVRILPRGVAGIKNKLHPSVVIHTHHLKSVKHKIFISAKCRKTLGSDQYCPICEAAWGIYNQGKAVNDKPLMDLGKSRLPTENHLINVYLRNDLTNPANNGLVKIWEHTPKMNKTLFDPTRDDTDKSKPTLKKKEIFYPYSPKDGRDYLVVVTENPENQMPSYESSEWDRDGKSDIASTNDEIMAILDKCHDLSKYLSDVPSSEQLSQIYTEFLSRVEEKERLANINGGGTPSTPEGSYKPASKATTGDAQAFFGGAKTESASVPASTPVAAPPATPIQKPSPVSLPDDEPSIGDEDELPF